MKATRKLITVNEDLCNGCGNCVTGCAEGALAIVDGKAKLVNEVFCDGLGACLGECPTGALKVVEVECEDFDPAAVTRHLSAQGREVPDHMPDPASLRLGAGAQQGGAPKGGCPSRQVMTFDRADACGQANAPAAQATGPSQLSHWPIQLRLVPPAAPFLKGARLLLAADCVPPSMPDFNARMLPGRVLLLGCPKFDDATSYIQKLAEILAANDIQDITVARMEVPCCAGMSMIAQKAVAQAGTNTPVSTLILSRDGRVLPEDAPLPGAPGRPYGRPAPL
jgi:Pyruvate/2-oxoacid:ferredoxin oxidoreductase delta subunit